ncbi:hypothetical protein [Gluconobacter thailandicus]|nr:hypothetical protein [Gluconobacter thailandicus]
MRLRRAPSTHVTRPRKVIARTINGFYNPQRLHSALQWNSPLDHERNAA